MGRAEAQNGEEGIGWWRGHCLDNVGLAGSGGRAWCCPLNSLAEGSKQTSRVPFYRLLSP